jgi:cell division protein FtsB
MSTTTGPGPGAPQVPPGGGHGWSYGGGPPAPAPGGHPGTPPPPPPPAPPGAGAAPAPGAAPAAPKAKRRRSSRSRKPGLAGFVADKAIPLLIAVLGLVAALATTYGAMVTSRANDAEATSTRLKRQVADLNDTNDSLTTDNSDLEAQVADLSDQLDELERQLTSPDATATSVEGGVGGGEETSTGPSGTGDHTATILRQTGDAPVTFSAGYSIDLDSPAPDWGVSAGSAGDVDFSLSGTTPRLGTPEMSVVGHVPTKAECDDATVLQPNFPQDLARVGTQFCTHTYGGPHTAYVHIADINTDNGTITLDIIVWR